MSESKFDELTPEYFELIRACNEYWESRRRFYAGESNAGRNNSKAKLYEVMTKLWGPIVVYGSSHVENKGV